MSNGDANLADCRFVYPLSLVGLPLLGDQMYLRNRAVTVVIAAHFMVTTFHAQSDGHRGIFAQTVRVKQRNTGNAALRPGRAYRDALASGGKGPEMVVLPEGKFVMGSPKSEAGR
jgi:hypothetical protein